ncbi:MAG: nuclear transport factor 2 family protein [Afipia sp.]
MDRTAAKDFARHWEANWRAVDIDAVVSHFADDAEMRSPLAVTLTGSAVVKGASEIRSYWQKAYGHIEQADIRVLSSSWDDELSRLTIWWQLGDVRASELMDFGTNDQVIRSEAFYGK